MTLLSIALLGNHPESISLGGMFHNLLWVTIGNVIGGSLFMAMGYWKASDAKRPLIDDLKGSNRASLKP